MADGYKGGRPRRPGARKGRPVGRGKPAAAPVPSVHSTHPGWEKSPAKGGTPPGQARKMTRTSPSASPNKGRPKKMGGSLRMPVKPPTSISGGVSGGGVKLGFDDPIGPGGRPGSVSGSVRPKPVKLGFGDPVVAKPRLESVRPIANRAVPGAGGGAAGKVNVGDLRGGGGRGPIKLPPGQGAAKVRGAMAARKRAAAG